MTSNISQTYPYSSESEAERAAAVEATLATHEGLADLLAAESTPLDDRDRWWTYHHAACGGLLHVAGYAREKHAVVALCDRCGRTALR
jgi:hypothetical protein